MPALTAVATGWGGDPTPPASPDTVAPLACKKLVRSRVTPAAAPRPLAEMGGVVARRLRLRSAVRAAAERARVPGLGLPSMSGEESGMVLVAMPLWRRAKPVRGMSGEPFVGDSPGVGGLSAAEQSTFLRASNASTSCRVNEPCASWRFLPR